MVEVGRALWRLSCPAPPNHHWFSNICHGDCCSICCSCVSNLQLSYYLDTVYANSRAFCHSAVREFRVELWRSLIILHLLARERFYIGMTLSGLRTTRRGKPNCVLQQFWYINDFFPLQKVFFYYYILFDMHCSSPRLWKKIRRREWGKKINLLCCSSDYVVPGVRYEIECYLLRDEFVIWSLEFLSAPYCSVFFYDCGWWNVFIS